MYPLPCLPSTVKFHVPDTRLWCSGLVTKATDHRSLVRARKKITFTNSAAVSEWLRVPPKPAGRGEDATREQQGASTAEREYSMLLVPCTFKRRLAKFTISVWCTRPIELQRGMDDGWGVSSCYLLRCAVHHKPWPPCACAVRSHNCYCGNALLPRATRRGVHGLLLRG